MTNYAERYQHLLPDTESEGQVERLLIHLADPPNWPTDDYDDCDATAVEFLEHVACAFAEAADNRTAIADPLADSAIRRIVETAIDDLTAGADSDHIRTRAAIGLGALRVSLDGFRVSSETTVADAVDFALLEIGRRLCVALDRAAP